MRTTLIAFAIVISIAHTWAAAKRQSMNSDGICYLDLGDAFWNGDWNVAINAVWSPLYPLFLGMIVNLANPKPYWEFPLVHLVNLWIFLLTLFTFNIFLRELFLTAKSTSEMSSQITFPAWTWIGVFFLLFIWVSTSWIRLWAVTPDLLMAGLVFLAAAVTLQIVRSGSSIRSQSLLGAVLGVAYLAKSIMLPVGLLWLVSVYAKLRRRGDRPNHVAFAFATFLLVVAPFVTALSIQYGSFTIGEAGKLTYLRYVNSIPYPYWQGGAAGANSLPHPVRKIFEKPKVYEFSEPISGTYPVMLDPSYWYAGVEPEYGIRIQMIALLENSVRLAEMFVGQQGGFLAILLLLLFMVWRLGPAATFNTEWTLLAPALGAVFLYSLVYVESRYLGVFVVLLWAALLMGISFRDTELNRLILKASALAIMAMLALNLLSFNLEKLRDYLELQGASYANRSAHSKAPDWLIAEKLAEVGVTRGMTVALVGRTTDALETFWARLARVRIVAEVPLQESDQFWLYDHSRQQIMDQLRKIGVDAIVAEHVPGSYSREGWTPLDTTGFSVLKLNP